MPSLRTRTWNSIYESRPNVTVDAAALCLKSGNGVLLKGGSAAFESNKAIHRAIRTGLLLSGAQEGGNSVLITSMIQQTGCDLFPPAEVRAQVRCRL